MSLFQIRGLGSPVSWGDVLFFGVVLLLWRHWDSLSAFATRTSGVAANSALHRFVRATVLSTLIGLYFWQHRPAVNAIAIGGVALACMLVLEVLGYHAAKHSNVQCRNVSIVGSGRIAMTAWRAVRTGGIPFEHFCGFIDDVDIDEMPPDVADRYLGTLETLPELLLDKEIENLIVAIPLRKAINDLDRIVATASALGTRVLCVRDVFSEQHFVSQNAWDELFIELLPAPRMRGTGHALKRGFDIAVSALCLLLGWPLVIAVMSIQAARGKRFAIRREVVYGHGRRQFQMLTLLAGEDATRVSRIVNCIPKMWNVFRGEMSLVGPRPLAVRDALYADLASLSGRFSVRPGVVEIEPSLPSDVNAQPDKYLTSPARPELGHALRQNWSMTADLKALSAAFQTELQGGDTRTL